MTTKPSRTSSPGRFPAGSVVVVPFPYSDRLSEKRRPAVVVSAPEVEGQGLLWILMVTTAKRGLGVEDVSIDEPETAGLTVPCIVRPTKIACIEPSRVIRRAGTLPPAALRRVLDRARAMIVHTPD